AGDGGDVAAADLAGGRVAPHGDPEAIVEFLRERGVDHVEWSGWELLDAYERSLGEPHGRERIKVVPREGMIRIARGEAQGGRPAAPHDRRTYDGAPPPRVGRRRRPRGRAARPPARREQGAGTGRSPRAFTRWASTGSAPVGRLREPRGAPGHG